MNRRLPLVALAGAQFIMVLDQSVMNVSISQLVAEFDTTVTVIQAVITLYCLVMAMLMLTGGKIGDIIGRRRAFVIGLVIYAFGSGLTAVSQTVAQLTLGWSILEGIGAALVLPAMAALIAGNFEGKERKGAYAVIGGVAGAGIAIGPILGGWATTELSLADRVRGRGRDRARHPGDGPLRPGRASARARSRGSTSSDPSCPPTGLGLIVLGVLQSTTWGVDPAEGLADRPVRVRPHAVRDRGRRRPDLGVRRVAAAPRAGRQGPVGPPRPGQDPDAAGRPRRPVLAEPHPDGGVLHDPAVSAARPRARRPADRPQDAARLDRDVRRGGRRVPPVHPATPSAPSPGPAWRSPACPACSCWPRSGPTSPTRPSRCRWRRSAWGWASWRPSSASSSSRPSTPRAVARPAACSTPVSSSGHRWASR